MDIFGCIKLTILLVVTRNLPRSMVEKLISFRDGYVKICLADQLP
jgi:hypothetical protein